MQKRVSIQERYSTFDLKEWLRLLYDFKGASRILDLGCGDGRELLYFSPFISRGTGVDGSKNLIQKAKQARAKNKIDNIEFVCADCNEFLQKDTKYDVIYSNFAFYYFEEKRVLKNILKMLNREGVVYIGGSPEENAAELSFLINELLDESEIPQTYKKDFSDIKKYYKLFKKYFDFVHFYRFVNTINFPSAKHFLQYLENTTLLQTLVPEKRTLFMQNSSRILRTRDAWPLTKIVDVLKATNK